MPICLNCRDEPVALTAGADLDVADYASFDAISAQELNIDHQAVLDAVSIVFPHSDEVYEMYDIWRGMDLTPASNWNYVSTQPR